MEKEIMDGDKLIKDFKDAVVLKNEQQVEQEKQLFRDLTAETRLEADEADYVDKLLENMERLEDRNAKMKAAISREKVTFWMLSTLCVIVAIARFVAW